MNGGNSEKGGVGWVCGCQVFFYLKFAKKKQAKKSNITFSALNFEQERWFFVE
jgi:hypothetical protein